MKSPIVPFTPDNKEDNLLIRNFLGRNQDKLTVNMNAQIKSGRVRLADTYLVVRTAITASGTQELLTLTGQTIKQAGILNFDGNKLETDRVFVIKQVGLNYGVATTGTSAAAVNYTTALPAALKTATLEIKQEGQLIFSIPVTAINEAKSAFSRYLDFLSYYLLVDQKTIEVNIVFASGADLAPGAGNSGYVELLLGGTETIGRR